MAGFITMFSLYSSSLLSVVATPPTPRQGQIGWRWGSGEGKGQGRSYLTCRMVIWPPYPLDMADSKCQVFPLSGAHVCSLTRDSFDVLTPRLLEAYDPHLLQSHSQGHSPTSGAGAKPSKSPASVCKANTSPEEGGSLGVLPDSGRTTV